MYGGPEGWRWAMATSDLVIASYGLFYWFAITDGPRLCENTQMWYAS